MRVIGYHGVGDLVILDENVNEDNYFRTLSENLLGSVKNILGGGNIHSCFIMTMIWPTRCVVLSHGWSSRTYPPFNGRPSPLTLIWSNKFGILWAERSLESVTRNDLIRALHISWLIITMPYLHNLCNSLPRRVRAVIRGWGYPTEYWLTKYFQKRQYLNMSHSAWKKYSFAANHRDKITFLIIDINSI